MVLLGIVPFWMCLLESALSGSPQLLHIVAYKASRSQKALLSNEYPSHGAGRETKGRGKKVTQAARSDYG